MKNAITSDDLNARRALVDAVIRYLGGTNAVADMLDVVPSAVSNWRSAGRFPSHTYVLMASHLRGMGARATPGYLWGMTKKKSRS